MQSLSQSINNRQATAFLVDLIVGKTDAADGVGRLKAIQDPQGKSRAV